MNSFFLVAGGKPKLNKYTSGQEYYLRTMISTLKEIGYPVKILSKEELSEMELADSKHIHFYYAPLKTIIRSRLTNPSATKCFHVYHLEDVTWSATKTLKWKTAVVLSGLATNRYLVTSRGLRKRLEKFTPKDKIVKVEPYYSCKCDSFSNIKSLIEERIEKISSGSTLKLLYLGRCSSKRIPLTELTQTLKKYSQQREKRLELKIISASDGVPNIKKAIGNDFTLEIRKKYLSEGEKCELYRKADFFTYLPKGNVAMNPPITVLEAIYHGVIPLVTPPLLKDLDVPKELIVRDASELPSIIENLSKENARERTIDALTRFGRFYDKSRYVKSLQELMEG